VGRNEVDQVALLERNAAHLEQQFHQADETRLAHDAPSWDERQAMAAASSKVASRKLAPTSFFQ
jgi:hypothetical protein